MKKFSYKSLFLILFLLLIGIVVLWKYAIPQKQVKAAWWNDGWNYRKAIVVNNNSNFDAIKIPYKISVNTKDLIDNGKLQADADDVRIVDNEGNLVRHQVEKKTLNSVDTKIWFEVNVKSKTSSEYYLYYGNSSANLQNFESDIESITSDTGSVVALMKDGFSYSTSYSYGRTSGIYKNGSSLNVTGNYHYTNAYPGNWWDDRVFTQSILNQIGPLFVEVNYSDTNYGGYSSYGTNIKIFDNGFAETMVYMTYNTSGSDTLYYYLNFSTGTRNSVWVNSSGVLVDQAANSGELYESTLGENWFGQRWVSDNKYGGTIITRNGTDWHHGGTSAQNSYYQTNYSFGQSYVLGTYREIRYGIFAGDGGLSEMQIKGANYGGLGNTVSTEEAGGGPLMYWKFDNSDVDDNYSRLDYVKIVNDSTNGYLNGINTNIQYKNATKMEFKVKSTDTSANVVLVSGYSGPTTRQYPCILGSDTIFASNFTTAELTPSDVTRVQFSDGEIRTFNLLYSTSSLNTIFFGSWSDSTWSRTIDWYSFKIWNGETLLADFIPVKRISDNSIGFYDSVSGGFYSNSGSGNFIAGNTIALDSAGFSNANIYNAQYVSEENCISGKCLYFNGSAYVNTNFGVGRDISINPLSISMWVKPTAAGNLMFISPNQGLNQRFYFSNYNGKWDFGVQNYGWGNGTIPVVLNKWVHVEIVADGSKVIMYVDGKITHQQSYTSFTFPENIVIGQHGSSTAYRFYGYIDDVKIYPYARNSDEIKQDINSLGSFSGSSVNLGVKPNTTPSIKSSLSVHYKLDVGSGSVVYDSSGNNKNSTFSIGTSSPAWSSGYFDKALFFDGNDTVLMPNEIVSNSSIRVNGITYSVWIKANSVSSTNKIFGQKPSTGYSDYASGGIDISSGKARMIAYDDNIAYKYATGNTTLETNRWYFLTGVYDPSDKKIKIYVNGKYDGGEAGITTFNRLVSNDYNSIGSHNASSMFFNGYIDEIKIYNRVLSPGEILQDYNRGSSIQFGTTSQNIGGTVTSLKYCIPGDNSLCNSPIGEWLFEENSGLTTKDTSGNNNNASFGSTSYSPAWVSGKNNEGAALYFDGIDDRATLASTINLVDNNNWTVSAWVKTNSGGTILSNSSGGPVANDLKIANNKISYAHYSGAWLNEYGNTNVSDGKWHHLTWVNHSSKTMDMYVDGIGDTYGVNSAQSSGPVNQIGRNWATTFSGTIDQVKIYNYARTPAQIAYDYNKGEPIAWFKFDECQGNIVNNSSSIGITGIINIGSAGSQNTLGTCAVGSSAAWTNGSVGKINASLNFDGVDDYVIFGDPVNGSLDFGINDFTLSAWIKSSVPQTSVILGKYNTYPLYYMRLNASGVLESRIGFDSSTNYSNTGISSVVDGKWHHVVSVFQRNGSIINYLDGILHGTPVNISASSTRSVDTTNSFTIGVSLSTQFFIGQIDDVKIFNYALTSEQVKLVYNNGAINFN